MSHTTYRFPVRHRLLHYIWNSPFPGKGTAARFLAKLLIPKPTDKGILYTLHGFRLLVDPVIDQGVEESLYYFGTYERGTLHFIKKHLKAGDVFVDVGANIGLMSVFASRIVGPTGKVVAFEPNPATAAIFEQNIALNGCENISLVRCALGDRRTTLTLFENWDVNRGGATLVKPSKESAGFDVKVMPFRELEAFSDLKPKIVKIDVEGFETDVLKGMDHLLASSQPPVLIVEYSPLREGDTGGEDLYDYLSRFPNYRICKLSRSKERTGSLLEVRSKTDLPQHDNLFCIPR